MYIDSFRARPRSVVPTAAHAGIALAVFAGVVTGAAGGWFHDGMITHEIPLAGEASGGTLAVTRVHSQDPKFISVPTVAGETGDDIAARISAAASSTP